MSKNKAVLMDQIYLVIIIFNSSSNFLWTLVTNFNKLPRFIILKTLIYRYKQLIINDLNIWRNEKLETTKKLK